MKIYVTPKGITLCGKAWEIKQKLKEYQQHYHYLHEWIEYVNEQKNDLNYPQPTLIRKK